MQQNEYWMVASDGGIFSFGGAQFYGSTGNIKLNQPIVGMASTPDGGGYWFVASDGGIFTEGDAGWYGSHGGAPLNKPIVGMAAMPSGHGYWLVASDGGIFTYGDAGWFGSAGATPLAKPIVGMAATPTGHGYWLVASDGGIFAYGDAIWYGSMGGAPLAQPVVGMAPVPDGRGYWLVAADGGIFSFGDAHFYGSTGNIKLNKPIVGMTATRTGHGYWFVASDGGIFTYGDALFSGSMGSTPLAQPVVGMAATPTLFASMVGLSQSATSVPADGVSTVSLTGLVSDASGTPIPGDALNLTVTTPGCGGLNASSAVTDLTGHVSATYTASTTLVSSCSIQVSEAFGPHTATVQIGQVVGPPAHLAATPATSSYTADQGNSGIPATFTLTDAYGHRLSGFQVDLSTTLANATGAPASAVTDSNGAVALTLMDTTAGDSGTVTGTLHGTGLTASTGKISLLPGAAHTITVTGPGTAQTAGTAYSATVGIVDTYGNAINPATSQVSLGGTALGTAPDGSHTGTAAFTGAFSGGQAGVSATSYLAGSGLTLTAAYGGITGSTAVNVGNAAPTTLAASPSTTTTKTADQMAGGLPLAFSLTDAYGNPIPSASLTIGTTGAGFPHATPALPATLTTGALGSATPGVAAFTLIDTNIADGGTVKANLASPALNAATGTITINPGALASLTLSAISAQTAGVQYAVTVHAADAFGNAVNPQTSAVVPSGSALATAPDGTHTGTASFAAAFSGGSATLNVTTYNAGSAQLTVTDTPVSRTSPLYSVAAAAPGIVTATPAPGTPASYTADQGSSGIHLTFTVTDPYGNPLSGVTVSLGKTGLTAGTLSPALSQTTGDGTANSVFGVAKVTLTDTTAADSGTVSATVQGTSITGTTAAITITPGGYTQLTLNTIGTQAAGTAYSVTITGRDTYGNPVNPPSNVVTFSGTALATAPDGTHTGSGSAGAFSNGVSTATVTSYLESTGAKLSATDSGVVANSNSFVISAAAPASVTPNPATGTTTSRTADQMSSGLPITFTVNDAYANPVGGQSLNVTTTPSSGFSHASTGPPSAVSTGTGSGSTTLGVATFSVIDTNTADGGTITATVPSSVSGTTGTITITPGKLDSLSVSTASVDPPAMNPTAGSPYRVTVTAKDHWGNTAQPPTANITPSGSALDTAPDGSHAGTASFAAPFASGTATMNVTSYKAESASITLTDSTNTFSGNPVAGTSPAYTVSPAAAMQVLSTSTSFVGSGGNLVFSGTGGGTATVNLAVTDQYQNPQTLADAINLTLTAESGDPDKGKLQVGSTPSLTDDALNPVTAQVTLSSGTGSFQYLAPATNPASGAGTITMADATHPTITFSPSNIGVETTTVTAVSVVTVQCTTSCTATQGNSGIALTFKAVNAMNAAVSGAKLDVTPVGFPSASLSTASPQSTDASGQISNNLIENQASTGTVRVQVHNVPTAAVNLVTATPSITINPGAINSIAISKTSALPPQTSGYLDQTAGQQFTLYVDSLDQFGNLTNPGTGNIVIGGSVITTNSPNGTAPTHSGTMTNGQQPLQITTYDAASSLTLTASCSCVTSIATASFKVNAGAPASVVATPAAASSASQYTSDQGNAGIPVTFNALDNWGNIVPSTSIDVTKTGLANATGVSAGGTSGSDSTPFSFTFNDTKAGDSGSFTGTVHGTSVHNSTNTITITAGAVKTLTLSNSATSQTAVPTQTAGTAYTVYVNAVDTYGNPTNPPLGNTFPVACTPTSSPVSCTGTALASAPDGTAAIASFPAAFSNGQASLQLKSYRAQAAASSGGNLNINCMSACASAPTSATASFAIVPGATSQVVARDGTGTYLTGINVTTGAQSQVIVFDLEDQYKNAAASQNGTVHVVLTPGLTPDGGSLSGSGQSTPSDSSGAQSLDLNLAQSGGGQVTYQAPGTKPPTGSSGSITWSDGSLISSPTSISITSS